MNDEVKNSIASLFAFVALMAFALILRPLLGWLAGWAIQPFFGDSILAVFARIGLAGFSLPQIGATLGFIGAFLVTQSRINK